jgi:hypothetical protein
MICIGKILKLGKLLTSYAFKLQGEKKTTEMGGGNTEGIETLLIYQSANLGPSQIQ